MKYVVLTSFWSLIGFGGLLSASLFSSFGLHAETQMGEAKIYPTHRFYRGGVHSSVTEATLERVFFDRLTGGALARKGAEKERETLSKRLASHLYDLCVEHRMDPAFVLSVIQVESSFRIEIESYAGAIGLMQVMPGTARMVAQKEKSLRALVAKNPKKALRDPFTNLTLGVKYLKYLRDRYAGLSPYFHLAAYNMGPYRLDQLRARPDFKPTQTLKYYENIMRGVGNWRYYGSRRRARAQSPRKAATQLNASKIKPARNAANPLGKI
jgi:hypothetical protein